MAAANGVEDDFESWLSFKLRSLKTDESVFGTYISGILNGEETIDEKTEALEGILSVITETDISSHCHEILEKWRHSRGLGDGEAAVAAGVEDRPAENMDERLVKLMESSTKTTLVTREYTDEEKRIKQAILAHYSQTSDHEFDSDTEQQVKVKEENGLEKNTNASTVAQAEREKRERAKLDSQKKKEKDKEDREKQKQQQQEKKEKRKTQKGERRR